MIFAAPPVYRVKTGDGWVPPRYCPGTSGCLLIMFASFCSHTPAPGRGVRLERPPGAITPWEVISHGEGPIQLAACLNNPGEWIPSNRRRSREKIAKSQEAMRGVREEVTRDEPFTADEPGIARFARPRGPTERWHRFSPWMKRRFRRDGIRVHTRRECHRPRRIAGLGDRPQHLCRPASPQRSVHPSTETPEPLRRPSSSNGSKYHRGGGTRSDVHPIEGGRGYP